MKYIYRLLIAAFLCLFTYFLRAQNIDTTGWQKNQSGKISFAHVSNAKMADAINFLKNTLQSTSNDSFVLIKETTDKLGMIHKRYQQYYKGIKVENAQYLLHGRNGSIETMNGDFQIVNIASVKPTLSEQQALTDALNYINAKEYKWQDSASENFIKQTTNNPKATYYPKGELVTERDYLKGGKNLLLVWKFSISSLNPNNVQLIYVDANTGEIINTTPQMLDTNTPLTAQTKYTGTQTIMGDSYAGGYRLRENRNGVDVETLNLQNTYNYSNAIDFTNTNTSFTNGNWTDFTQDQQALDAHWSAENVLDFWKNVFNRNSLDGNGIRVLGYVHAGSNWNNAQWVTGTGYQFMQYGDGDGTTLNPFTALDICAHEMGHGIDEFTANLTPGTQESGALNEGFSDIWGASIEQWAVPTKQTWLMGEEIFRTSSYDCVRNLQNPKDNHVSEGQHPDTYHGTYWSSSGEPHTNSTILSHWFYLLSQGGSGTNDNSNSYSVTGIGIAEAEEIAWRTESAYLDPTADYLTTRTESIQAAKDLYCDNSPEVIAVTNAWYAVGVGTAYSGLSISGDNTVCSTSNNYIIPNLPTGATVTWSASPSGIVSINSPNSLQTTLTKITNGTITLTATISNLCGGNNIVINSQIGVGYTQILNIGYPSSTVAPNELIPMQIFIAPDSLVIGNQKLVIKRTGGGYSNTLYTGGDGAIEFSFSMTGTYTIKVYTYNDCGWSTNFYPLVFFCTNEGMFMISPNPANTALTVKLSDETVQAGNEKSNAVGIKEIQLTDKMGNVLKRYVYSGTDKQVTMDVSTLKADIYYIKVFNGKQWQGKSFIKQ